VIFRSVDARVSFPQMEEEVLRFWKDNSIFEKSIENRRGAPPYTFNDGPPTTNGSPGIHHVLSRLFKDIPCRYKTMKGFWVPRKAGWDTHGLPVELEVEHTLGLRSKKQIEEYGVAEFNRRCRESVFKYIRQWEQLVERIGHWIDMDDPYITLKDDYIESGWWGIKQMWDNGFIYRGYRTTPHCPRCGTSLSSHEVALGYEENTEDPSVYIKFRVTDEALKNAPAPLRAAAGDGGRPVYLLAWTTTPWTLPGNTALAVAPDARYAVLKSDEDCLVMADALVDVVGVEGYERVSSLQGSELVGLRYEPLFNPHDYGVQRLSMPDFEVQDRPDVLSYPVIGADFVSLDDGTGIVHTAPSFGEVDFDAGMREKLDFVQQVDLDGKVTGTYTFAGKFVKDADPEVLADLESRGLVFRSTTIRHTYPFCWRCGTPLLYYVKRSWYIRTTAKKERLVSGNLEVNWYPEYIKYGRFGDWLENNVDWAFSRERYWGTPLPVWECPECGRYECVGSRAELASKPDVEGYYDGIELHRPYVDEITFSCPGCGARMKRVPEVIDCWFDSGAMTWAQWHYPFENVEFFEKQMFPVDYVCEAIDQTRGWFYSLHALSTMVFDGPCFRNVLCLGHVVDANGEKMSKSKGNVIDPWMVLREYGADALRWYMLSSVPSENTHRFSLQSLAETMRRHMLTLWNTYSFFVLYANIDGFVPGRQQPRELAQLDRWILSELNQVIVDCTKAMDSYSFTQAVRRIEQFINLLSNWYVRRSRRRFWKSENDDDKLAAHTTLYQCLVTLSKLLAPLVPFISEVMYRNLVLSVEAQAPQSVHLTDYPVADTSLIDEALNRDMELAMNLSSLGRAARAKAGIKVRQPLSKVVITLSMDVDGQGVAALSDHIRDELNVKDVEFADVTPQDDGYVSASDERNVVAVMTVLSPELVAEGLARELVRRLQMMRRSANFEISDHIVVYYRGGEELEGVFDSFGDYICQETLATALKREEPPESAYTETIKIGKSELLAGVERSS